MNAATMIAEMAGGKPISGYPTNEQLAALSPAGVLERLKLLAHSPGRYKVYMYPADGTEPVMHGRFRREREAQIYARALEQQTGNEVEIRDARQ